MRNSCIALFELVRAREPRRLFFLAGDRRAQQPGGDAQARKEFDQPDEEDDDQDRDDAGRDDQDRQGLHVVVEDAGGLLGQAGGGFLQGFQDGREFALVGLFGERRGLVRKLLRLGDRGVDGILVGLVDHVRTADAGRDDQEHRDAEDRDPRGQTPHGVRL